MKVTWRGIRKQELSEQEVFERSRPSFFLDDETSARVPQRFEVLLHTKNAFYLQWQPSAQAGEESSDEELDPELYGPPGVLGI
eukprot:g18206.t1